MYTFGSKVINLKLEKNEIKAMHKKTANNIKNIEKSDFACLVFKKEKTLIFSSFCKDACLMLILFLAIKLQST